MPTESMGESSDGESSVYNKVTANQPGDASYSSAFVMPKIVSGHSPRDRRNMISWYVKVGNEL